MASDRGADDLDYGDDIDRFIFEQILEMDEEDDHEFSSQIVFDFFDQATVTFEQMDKAVEKKDCQELGNLGHFLKGSSATLGLIKVRDACEKIQNWGQLRDEADRPIAEEDALTRIKNILPTVKKNCEEVEKKFRAFYPSTSE